MFKVWKPGFLTTIQDLGRTGFQKDGFIVSGAIDPFSLRIANILVGNSEQEAGLEITLQGPTLSVEEDTVIAITGGDLTPMIQNNPLPMWRPIFVPKGSLIEWGGCKTGCRAYLSVAGGLSVPKVLGSKSTYLRAGIGGFEGRGIKKGDTLFIEEKPEHPLLSVFDKDYADFSTVSWQASPPYDFANKKTKTVRVLPGVHYSQFTNESLDAFFQESFQVHTQSDRMGYRLHGPLLERRQKDEILSEAVTLGTVQVPADGNPVILLADRQTTGGYPRIAQVISVDISVVAQTKPGEQLHFKAVTWGEAESLYVDRQIDVHSIKSSTYEKLRQV
ncbi:antagonist of KipI [Salibacterium salarium]|uniref:5-oxoprolinase subunit C family protein n=1 Tax=Salibacterium salarium TaxID=284579 RepID=UPI00278336AB|nr:biotin-dependent carboxyltransferase family protein [Salibacterium salarium]MDQ0300606.1 antagonist of KipI [Salibacterium salarium]